MLEIAGKLLLSTESYAGKTFTKFPGGALEFGEGLKAAVEREFMEETGLSVVVKRHIYTTDFFQKSAFNSSHQIISVYYEIEHIDKDFSPSNVISKEDRHEFFWVDRRDLSSDHLTFPIDKYVCENYLI